MWTASKSQWEFIGDYARAGWRSVTCIRGNQDTGSPVHRACQLMLSAAQQDALELGISHYGIREHFLELVGCDNIYARGKVVLVLQWIQ